MWWGSTIPLFDEETRMFRPRWTRLRSRAVRGIIAPIMTTLNPATDCVLLAPLACALQGIQGTGFIEESELVVPKRKFTKKKKSHDVKTQTIHLKVHPSCYAWLEQASREVNQVWNFLNATHEKAAKPYFGKPNYLTAFDMNKLIAGMGKLGDEGEGFQRIGSAIAQCVSQELATRCKQFLLPKLRFRKSGGSKRSLGWIPFKRENIRMQGNRLRFMGKSIRVFERERFEKFRAEGKMCQGNFAQNALGEWFLNIVFEMPYPEGTQFNEAGLPLLPPAPKEEVGLDPGLKSVVVTSDGVSYAPNKSYRNLEEKIAQAQRRGHKKQAKRLHQKAKNQRFNTTNEVSREIVDTYQTIYIGDVSPAFLRSGNKAKSALDGAWGMLKAQLLYKGHWAGRTVEIVSERNTTRACYACGALTGPAGQKELVVREWTCSSCQTLQGRDHASAKNMLPSAPMRRRPSAGTSVFDSKIS